MSLRLSQVAVSTKEVLQQGSDDVDVGANAPRIAADALEKELASSARSPAGTPRNPISAPLPAMPVYVDLKPAGARQPVPMQFVTPYDLSQDSGVRLPAIGRDRAHAREDAMLHCLVTPGKLPTFPRSKKTTKKSRHRSDAARVASELGFPPSRCYGDGIQSLEESVKTLLLCQSMGVVIQITKHGDDSSGLAQPLFHCNRCLKHWADYGRLPPDCKEPEARVSGPSFTITSRSQEILQRFSELTFLDKQCFLEAIQAQARQPPRGENSHRRTMSHEYDRTSAAGTGHVEMSVTGKGDKAGMTGEISNLKVHSFRSRPVQEASEPGGSILTNRDQKPGRQEDLTPSDALQSLQLVPDGKVAKYSSPDDEHRSKCNREDNQNTDERDTKGNTDSCPVRTGTDVCLPSSTKDVKRDLMVSVAKQTASISSNRIVDQDKDEHGQEVNAAVARKLAEENQELVGTVPRKDGLGPNETRLPEDISSSPTQQAEESLLPAVQITVDNIEGLPEEHLMNISATLTNEPLTKDGGISSNTDIDTQTKNGEAGQDVVSNGNVLKDGEPLFDEETPSHAISTVTVTRNGLLHHYGTASCNNSVGADDVEFNESFDRLVNDEEDLNGQEHSATSGRKQEAKSARSGLGRHSNGDSGQSPGQERVNGRKTPTWKQNVGKGSQRESSFSYMGVMQDGEESLNGGILSAEEGNTSRGTTARGNKSASKDQRAAPIRNTAVHNVTGKSYTRPGNLKRHMFATPRETLAKTNALGMVPKSSGEGLAKDTAKQRGHLTQDSGSNAHPSSDPRPDGATTLPSLNTMPNQLPSMGVYDTEPRSKAKDRKRSLGLPRTDHGPQELADRQQKQEEVPTVGRGMDEEQQMYTSRPGKRQPVPRGKGEDASTGQNLPRQLTERPQKTGKQSLPKQPTERPQKTAKQKAQDDFAEQLSTKQKGERLSSALDDRFLPSIASTREELMGKEVSDQQELQELETKSPIKSLFSEFENFEWSLSPPPAGSLPPVSTDKSFRMTYSTLPKIFNWDTPRQPPLMSRGTPSPPPFGLPGNLEQQTTDEILDAKIMKQSTMVRRSSRNFYDKSACTPSRASGQRTRVYPSASESSQESSPAESVWESLSEIWRRQTKELQKLEQMVALNFLPLTSAFTFSLFQVPSQYLEHNRSLREQAMQIRTLKKPKKIVMKFASKEQRLAAMRPPMIRKPVKPVH